MHTQAEEKLTVTPKVIRVRPACLMPQLVLYDMVISVKDGAPVIVFEPIPFATAPERQAPKPKALPWHTRLTRWIRGKG